MNIKHLFRSLYILVLIGCGVSLESPSTSVIDEGNLEHLISTSYWDIDGLYPSSSILWFSDSSQFIVLSRDSPNYRIDAFKVDSSDLMWSVETSSPSVAINTSDEIITHAQGLQFIDRYGTIIQTIKTVESCDKITTSHLVAIPRSNLFISGHQVSISDFGLNYNVDDKSVLLLWDAHKVSCNVLKDINGQLWSVSTSYDGRYVSYSFGARDSTSYMWRSFTKVYDFDLQKETCNLVGSHVSFSNQDQLAVYNPVEKTISIVDPKDCSVQVSLEVGIEVSKLLFHPKGNLLAMSSKSAVGIWNIKDGVKLHQVDLQESSANFPLISFSPDGRYLIVAQVGDSLVERGRITLWGIQAK